jgi:predicted dithiol-disulfide oxidoreductase (DUF899 family)
MMQRHPVVSHDEWITARQALLNKEKEFTRLRDELSQQRRHLPWERVDKEYVFEGPKGTETLAQRFAGKSQLIAYHFMFAPDQLIAKRTKPGTCLVLGSSGRPRANALEGFF